MTDYFLLDPDYKDFPEKRKLKFLTVYGEQHTFIVLAVVWLIFGCVIISLTLKWLPLEVSYLMVGQHTEGIVTASCQSSEQMYAYSFEGINSNGQTDQYTGRGKSAKDKSCPKLGSHISVEYLSDQPELTARDRESALSHLGSMVLLIIFSLGFIKIGFDAIRPFIQTISKFARLQQTTRMIEGKIINARVTVIVFQQRVRNGHYIEVEYEFAVGDHTYHSKQVKRRQDLLSQPLPQPGTPVRILYADENTYVML